eukprot:765923-Hanusia_phi.AAC.9
MPRKQWIYEVIEGTREQDNVLIDNSDMVFLPDTHALNEGVRLLCTEYIMANTDWKRHNIMAYMHYLPSVFQLHIHFCAPYGSYTTLDILKVHPLDTVIGNLDMDGDYYRKATLSTVVVGNAALLAVYGLNVVRNYYRNVESHEVDPIQWRGILG